MTYDLIFFAKLQNYLNRQFLVPRVGSTVQKILGEEHLNKTWVLETETDFETKYDVVQLLEK